MQSRKMLAVGLGVMVIGAAGVWAWAAPQEQETPAGRQEAVQPTASTGAEAAAQAVDPNAPQKAKVGETAPVFELQDYAGKTIELADYKGKVVVLEWLNQECPWSRKARPEMKRLYEKYQDHKNVVWFGVDSTAGRKAADNEKYVKDEHIPYTILMDPDGKVGQLYGAKTTPHIFVIADGKLVYAGALHNNQSGREAETRNYLDEALTAVLAGEKVPLAETKPWGCGVKYAQRDGEQRGERRGGQRQRQAKPEAG